MHSAIRPWVTPGVVLAGASLIAATQVVPPPQVSAVQSAVPAVHSALPEVQLTASVLEIFTFPAFRQYIVNQISDLVNNLVAWAETGVAVGEAIAAIPETFVTVTQQVLSGDLVGALTTVQVAVVAAGTAIILPLLNASIENSQRYLAVQSALQTAVPLAFVQFGAGLLGAFNAVADATIVSGQELFNAVLSLDVANIVNAVVDGTVAVLGSFVDAGQDIVDGTVAAQQTIAAALAAQPSAMLMTAQTTDAGSVPELREADLTAFTLDTSEPSSTDGGFVEASENEGFEESLEGPTADPAEQPEAGAEDGDSDSGDDITDEETTPLDDAAEGEAGEEEAGENVAAPQDSAEESGDDDPDADADAGDDGEGADGEGQG